MSSQLQIFFRSVAEAEASAAHGMIYAWSDENLRYLLDLCFAALRALQGSNSSWVLSSSTQMWERVGAKCELREAWVAARVQQCMSMDQYGSHHQSTQARPNLCESCFTFLRRRITPPSQSWRCAESALRGHIMFKFDVADVYIPQDAKGSLVYNLSRRQVYHFFAFGVWQNFQDRQRL